MAYSHYETGERKISLAQIIRICEGLELTLDYLFWSDLSGLPQNLQVILALSHPVRLREAPRGVPRGTLAELGSPPAEGSIDLAALVRMLGTAPAPDTAPDLPPRG